MKRFDELNNKLEQLDRDLEMMGKLRDSKLHDIELLEQHVESVTNMRLSVLIEIHKIKDVHEGSKTS